MSYKLISKQHSLNLKGEDLYEGNFTNFRLTLTSEEFDQLEVGSKYNIIFVKEQEDKLNSNK